MASRSDSAEASALGETQTPHEVALYASATSWSGLPVRSGANDPLLGTVLHDTYVVQHVIGEGGMGRVYEAQHTRLPNKRFAIKVLHAEFAMNAALQQRFQREAETAASIEHPGIVGTYDIGRTSQGWQYMVSEHLRGIDLSTHIERSAPLDIATITHVGKRLCEAVEAAHAKGVIHRDLKPHNVFLVGDFALGVPTRPHLKVLDFGLSRFVDRDSQLTKTGMIMGTPGYMSPEQAHGKSTNPKTDVYGIGAILYAAAVGRAPFAEETPQMTVLAVMSREPDRPRALEPSIPESLEIIIQKAMAREPAQRYASARELHAALLSLEGRLAPSVLPDRPGSQPPELRGQARGARLRLGLLLLVIGAVLGASLSGAAAGFLALSHTRLHLTSTEWVLVTALAVVSSAPLIMALRRLYRRTWSNTALVVEWSERLREPVLAGLCAYGLAALATRSLDELATATPNGLFAHPPGIAYRGFSLALPLIGLLAALAWALHRNRRSRSRPLRRFVFGPLLAAGVALSSMGIVHFTLRQRASAPAAPVASAASGHEAVRSESAMRAPPQDLTNAIAEGTDGLRVLSERYPRDPSVLKALVVAFSSRTNTLIEAVEATRRLLLVAPAEQEDPDLQYVVRRAARKSGKATELAFVVMSQHMGKVGADLLYELMLNRPELETRARMALESLRRLEQFSPALAVAYDLRFAPGCAARLPLLERAVEVGDRRSAHLLSDLSRTPQGCSGEASKSRKCQPRCPAEAKELSQAARAIYRRHPHRP